MEPSASTGGVRLPLHQQTTRIDRILESANRLLATLFNLKDKAGRPYSHIPPGAEAFLPSSDFIASQKRKAAVDFKSTIQVAIRELDRLESFIPDPRGHPHCAPSKRNARQSPFSWRRRSRRSRAGNGRRANTKSFRDRLGLFCQQLATRMITPL